MCSFILLIMMFSLLLGDRTFSLQSEQVCRSRSSQPRRNSFVRIAAGTVKLGTDRPHFRSDGESPARSVLIAPFSLQQREVSVDEFGAFVTQTGHVTDAERYGWSFVLDQMVVPAARSRISQAVANAPWWLPVNNASWSNITGDPGSDNSLAFNCQGHDLPAVHVSWRDAAAYCQWLGGRLPSEDEWETACRGGLKDRLFPWGNALQPRGEHFANVWQGHFPSNNTGGDGFLDLAPTDSFPPNGYGLYNMVGNVWEWTADRWSVRRGVSGHFSNSDHSSSAAEIERVKKGGSFMCHRDYCYRHRCAARSHNTADTSAVNLGFRCAADDTQ